MKRLVATLAMLAGLAAHAEPAAEAPEESQFGETMTVVRYLVEARVTDAAGRAIRDVPAGEFVVTIGKARAHVEAADWIASATPPAARGDVVPGDKPSSPRDDGRLIVFFIQTDFGRNHDRVIGQMAFMSSLADRVVGLLQPGDRIAVLSFDSHLKLRCDFTTDRAAALEAIRRSIEIGESAIPAASSAGPSLAEKLDAKQAKATSSGEDALLLVAQALRQIEGKKLMFLAGWGFGEMSWGMGGGSRLVLPQAWSDAVGMLHRDHVPVITIGTGSGQLTLGIALTARATGGLHTSAVGFPEQTLTRIEGALAGYYELVLRMDEPLKAGEYPILVQLTDPRFRVQAAPAIVVERVDTRYVDSVELINAGQVDKGVQALRESMSDAAVPVDVLAERLELFVDAAQWEAALAVVERLEAAGAVEGEVARMRDEALRGASLRAKVNAHARLTEARQRMLEGKAEEALALLDQAIEIEPDLADAWYERGMLMLSQGRAAEAEANLRRYLELEPRGENADAAREVIEALANR